jgi:hypothetical protein
LGACVGVACAQEVKNMLAISRADRTVHILRFIFSSENMLDLRVDFRGTRTVVIYFWQPPLELFWKISKIM